jgi:hypothetical protein
VQSLLGFLAVPENVAHSKQVQSEIYFQVDVLLLMLLPV